MLPLIRHCQGYKKLQVFVKFILNLQKKQFLIKTALIFKNFLHIDENLKLFYHNTIFICGHNAINHKINKINIVKCYLA